MLCEGHICGCGFQRPQTQHCGLTWISFGIPNCGISEILSFPLHNNPPPYPSCTWRHCSAGYPNTEIIHKYYLGWLILVNPPRRVLPGLDRHTGHALPTERRPFLHWNKNLFFPIRPAWHIQGHLLFRTTVCNLE